ncbi:MAG: 3-hydroxyacyl-CoA dehydrogenase NAD-binding domain-containing protein [Gemmatimonadales bacterium]
MRIGVLGAGAMGTGIAQVAAVAGHPVVVADASAPAVAKARETIKRALTREVEKGRMTQESADAAIARIEGKPLEEGAGLRAFADCDLVIEAIVEDLGVKQDAFARLEQATPPGAILATNTSSLSVTAIAGRLARPGRVVGMHFFNPVPLMPLVEIIPGLATDGEVTGAVRDLAGRWNKVPVVAKDTPGFIVNRVARPFYGEALRIYDEGLASQATIDWAMRELGGFRMGPFELMDLIGNDVNFAVTTSVFEAMFYDPRYRPSITQQRQVEAGLLGRKSGRGYFDYAEGAERPPAQEDREIGQRIVDRIVAMLINEAADALFLGIASGEDLDLAMTKGVNYPKGLLAWADELGPATVLQRLEALQAEYGEDRYRPSPLLRRLVKSRRMFFDE